MKLNAQTVTQKDLVDTGRTLNVLCAFSLRPVFTEECSTQFQYQSSIMNQVLRSSFFYRPGFRFLGLSF